MAITYKLPVGFPIYHQSQVESAGNPLTAEVVGTAKKRNGKYLLPVRLSTGTYRDLTMEDLEDWDVPLTCSQAAKILKRDPSHVRRMIREGRLPGIKISVPSILGKYSAYLIRRCDVLIARDACRTERRGRPKGWKKPMDTPLQD